MRRRGLDENIEGRMRRRGLEEKIEGRMRRSWDWMRRSREG